MLGFYGVWGEQCMHNSGIDKDACGIVRLGTLSLRQKMGGADFRAQSLIFQALLHAWAVEYSVEDFNDTAVKGREKGISTN